MQHELLTSPIITSCCINLTVCYIYSQHSHSALTAQTSTSPALHNICTKSEVSSTSKLIPTGDYLPCCMHAIYHVAAAAWSNPQSQATVYLHSSTIKLPSAFSVYSQRNYIHYSLQSCGGVIEIYACRSKWESLSMSAHKLD